MSTISSVRRYSTSKRNTPALSATISDISSSPDTINLTKIDIDAISKLPVTIVDSIVFYQDLQV